MVNVESALAHPHSGRRPPAPAGAMSVVRSRLAWIALVCTPVSVLTAQGPPAGVPDAFFVPSRQSIADAMLALAEVTPTDLVYDLGSGDGRVLILAAQKYGARGVGIEIDPALVARARAVAEEGGVADRVRFIEGDLFTADISQATVVTLYLSTRANRRLLPKLRSELHPGARIVSQQFDLRPWTPDTL
ncbi:MAG: class I SAM-dependent methyltransferase, partial [Acidobacteriota bacterium]|nr:class I SAM-dependent methyltransferase [Acidobacteriota bacterium]